MEINDLEKKWRKKFESSLKSIKGMIEYKSHDDDFIKSIKDFMKWIIEGEEDPYMFLPNGFHYLRDDLETSHTFLSILYHALADDGDVAFVTLKLDGEIKAVRLVFSDLYMSGFRDIVLRENAQLIKIETDIYNHSVKFTEKINEKYAQEGKPLKKPKKEFKVEELEIISHTDYMKFKEEVISFSKMEKERVLRMEQRRKEILGKLSNS